MQLKKELVRGIASYGFEQPSLIQEKAVAPIIRGSNLIIQAPPLSGKTTAFIIACLQMVDPRLNYTQAMILAPTRELATVLYNVCS